MIHDLTEMVKGLLMQFYKTTKHKPERILFFRDGVSEGQFDKVSGDFPRTSRRIFRSMLRRENEGEKNVRNFAEHLCSVTTYFWSAGNLQGDY